MAILRMACIQTGRDDGSQLEAANPIEDMRLIRSAALDEWVGLPKRTDERLPERHMVAHGGRVMLDIDTIQAHHQLQRVTAWKEAFKNNYGLPYPWVLSRLDSIPDPIVTAMDRRASAHSIRHWHEKEQLSRTVLQGANVVSSPL